MNTTTLRTSMTEGSALRVTCKDESSHGGGILRGRLARTGLGDSVSPAGIISQTNSRPCAYPNLALGKEMPVVTGVTETSKKSLKKRAALRGKVAHDERQREEQSGTHVSLH